MCVTLTPAAAKFMQRMIRFGNVGAAAGFRLSVAPGGCTGFDSKFSIEAQARAGDTELHLAGVKLFLPAETCALLAGYRIDFSESRLEGGFNYAHPDKPGACGCGSGSGSGTGPGAGAQVVRFRPAACSKP